MKQPIEPRDTRFREYTAYVRATCFALPRDTYPRPVRHFFFECGLPLPFVNQIWKPKGAFIFKCMQILQIIGPPRRRCFLSLGGGMGYH